MRNFSTVLYKERKDDVGTIKGTVSVISIFQVTLHAKMAMGDSQRYLFNLCLIKYDLFYFICGFSAKVTCALLIRNTEEIIRKTTSSTFLIRLRFQGNHCKLGIAIFAGSLQITLTVPSP